MCLKYTLQKSLSAQERYCLHRCIFQFTAKLICRRLFSPSGVSFHIADEMILGGVSPW